MYAVIKTGGKQYRVSEGDVIKIEQLAGEAGEVITFSEVLMITDGENTTCGTPFLDKGLVTAKVLSQGRHKKVHIIKFRRRKHHMKKMGHRQNYTEVEITQVSQ